MRDHEFSALSAAQQMKLVLMQGTYLLWRRSQHGSVHLYHLPAGATGLFVELFYDPALDLLRIKRTFTDIGPLAEYLAGLRLPGWLRW